MIPTFGDPSYLMNSTVFYADDGISFYRNVCEMAANILAIIFLLKLSSKTHLKAPTLILLDGFS